MWLKKYFLFKYSVRKLISLSLRHFHCVKCRIKRLSRAFPCLLLLETSMYGPKRLYIFCLEMQILEASRVFHAYHAWKVICIVIKGFPRVFCMDMWN